MEVEKVGLRMSYNILIQRVDNQNIKIPQDISYQLSAFDTGLEKVSQYLTQAILLEVSTHPKPGLVTRFSQGSHKDMSIFTFMMSSAVLSKAFYDLMHLGRVHEGTLPELLNKVRLYGVDAEKELLRVTKGVNTQRGILFAGGILSAAAGYALKEMLKPSELLEVVKGMTSGIVDRELKCLKGSGKTAGEKLFAEYGITGIRGEVEAGFPSVVNYALPALEEAFEKKAKLNDALVHALLYLMTVVEDSNVLWRTDMATALEVKEIAQEILKRGSIFTEPGKALLEETEKYFESKRISPGGCADLLSIAVTLYLLEHKEFPDKII